MQLRISGGSARGRILATGKGLKTRPTPAGVREAVANILRPRLAGARVLDLFAGYGAAGLELLSCGAAEALFVEQSRAAARLIRENVDLLGFGDRAEVWQRAVNSALGALAEDGRSFDILFVDPPYERGLVAETLERLAESPALLAVGGTVVVQHSKREAPPADPFWERVKERVSGETVVTFLERAAG